MHGAAMRTGSRYSMARQMIKPAARWLPYMSLKRYAKPTSAPPVPPGSGTALTSSSSMEPDAVHSRRSAGSPNERSTKYGSAYMQPSWSRVTTMVRLISSTLAAELLKSREKTSICVFTNLYHSLYFSSLIQRWRCASLSAQLQIAMTGFGSRHMAMMAASCTTLKPKRKMPMRVTSPNVS